MRFFFFFFGFFFLFLCFCFLFKSSAQSVTLGKIYISILQIKYRLLPSQPHKITGLPRPHSSLQGKTPHGQSKRNKKKRKQQNPDWQKPSRQLVRELEAAWRWFFFSLFFPFLPNLWKCLYSHYAICQTWNSGSFSLFFFSFFLT